MLPKQNRLPLRTELKRLKKEGQIFQGRLFGLLLSPSPKAQNRFAFIISTKVHKKAVRRNHARRLLSAAIKEFLPAIKPKINVVFLAKKALIGADYSQIKKEMNFLFKKARIL